MIRAYDRAVYTLTYGGELRMGMLRVLELLVTFMPYRTLRRMADRADRREAEARYDDGAARVGILRRQAIDRYDVRSDATCVYYAELRKRNAGPCSGCRQECEDDEAAFYTLPTVGRVRLCLECGPEENRDELRRYCDRGCGYSLPDEYGTDETTCGACMDLT